MADSVDDPDGEKFIGALPWVLPCVVGLRKMIGLDACDADCDLGRDGFAEALREKKKTNLTLKSNSKKLLF